MHAAAAAYQPRSRIMSSVYRAPRTSEGELAFDNAPVVSLSKPPHWQVGAPGRTEVQAVWNQEGFHTGFKIDGKFESVSGDFEDKMIIAQADRVEVFLMAPGAPDYRAYEYNRVGPCLDYIACFGEPHDFSWCGNARRVLLERDGLPFLIISVPWIDIGLDSDGKPFRTGLQVGFYRGQANPGARSDADFSWSCWQHPGDDGSDPSFHRPDTFGDLILAD
jgi:hypothetical protein